MSDETEYVAVPRYLKAPPTARDEIAEHIESIRDLIGRHEAANAELLARVADRDQVIAGLRALLADYALCLACLPTHSPSDALDLTDLNPA